MAVRLDPKHASPYNNRANAYFAKDELDWAIADYDAAIRINPLPQAGSHLNVFVNRGNAYYVNKDYDRANQDYDQAIKLDSTYALSFAKRADAYEGKDNYPRAVLDYDQATRLKPSNASYWNALCWDRAIAG
jgi:tetratricopeptide (TPR) repeat protein